MTKSVKITIHGKVQGVFFRDFIKRKADELEVTGFVKNKYDGTVYAEAEGKEIRINKLIKFCEKGPVSAKVEKVEIEPTTVKNFEDFLIRH